MTDGQFRGKIQAIQWNNRIISAFMMLYFLFTILIFTLLYLAAFMTAFFIVLNVADIIMGGKLAAPSPQEAIAFLYEPRTQFKIFRIFMKLTMFAVLGALWFVHRDVKNAHIIFNAEPLKLKHNVPFYKALENMCIARGLKVPDLYMLKGPMPSHYVTAIVLQGFSNESKLLISQGAYNLPQPQLEALAAQAVQRLHTGDTYFFTLLCFLGYFPFHLMQAVNKYVGYIFRPFAKLSDIIMAPVRKKILNLRLARMDVAALTMTKDKGPMHELMEKLTPLKDVEHYYYEAWLPLFITRTDGPYRLRMLAAA